MTSCIRPVSFTAILWRSTGRMNQRLNTQIISTAHAPTPLFGQFSLEFLQSTIVRPWFEEFVPHLPRQPRIRRRLQARQPLPLMAMDSYPNFEALKFRG